MAKLSRRLFFVFLLDPDFHFLILLRKFPAPPSMHDDTEADSSDSPGAQADASGSADVARLPAILHIE